MVLLSIISISISISTNLNLKVAIGRRSKLGDEAIIKDHLLQLDNLNKSHNSCLIHLKKLLITMAPFLKSK